MKLRERGVKCQNTSHITRATAFEPKGFLRKECFIIHTPLNILPLHKNAGSLSYCVTQDYVSYRQQKPTSNHHRRKQERKLRTHIPSPQEEPVWSWPSANRSQGLYFSPSLETWPPTVPGSSPAATARKPVGRTLTDRSTLFSLIPQLDGYSEIPPMETLITRCKGNGNFNCYWILGSLKLLMRAHLEV